MIFMQCNKSGNCLANSTDDNAERWKWQTKGIVLYNLDYT